jgi:hypothetical protein
MIGIYSKGPLEGDHEALAVCIWNLRWHRGHWKSCWGPKLPMVCDAEHGRSSRELRLCQFGAMHGLCPGDWRVLHPKQFLSAPSVPSTRTAQIKDVAALDTK